MLTCLVQLLTAHTTRPKKPGGGLTNAERDFGLDDLGPRVERSLEFLLGLLCALAFCEFFLFLFLGEDLLVAALLRLLLVDDLDLLLDFG